ncbi:GntR family transcriptional regulator [Fodinicola acaciae]|uniref:GntR family transcriptional regulator n=1 Tax=Fodinicola acaciae TaxID=2681555 RepID=UPI0013D11AE8|nr:GntR family transcriptional regulator [Fodinicola acaciae]
MTRAGASGPRASARDVAYQAIRNSIITGVDEPGALLSENERALSLGLSRTPVREALLLLAHEGLVEVRPQSGTYVSAIDPSLVRQAQFIREAVETASLAQCAANFTAEHEKELRRILDAQDRCTGNREDFYPLDEEFHRTLLDIAGHGTAWLTVSGAKAHLDRVRYIGLQGHRPIHEFAADHRRVFEMLVAGELAQAQRELRTHLRYVLADLEAIQLELPEHFFTGEAPSARRVARPPRRNKTTSRG